MVADSRGARRDASVIPYGRQSIDEDDVAAVVAVLRGDWLTQGPAIDRFEHAVAERVEARHAVAFSNGTAALHGAMAAAGIGPGATVVTSALTFIASANCARYVGANVAVVDIDRSTLLLDPSTVPECDALVAVHYAGLPVDLRRLSRRPPLVVEDAAHALGASTPDGPVGSCARSDMCMFSFHPVKHITTGEGGIVTTNSDALAHALRRFRSHGTEPRPEMGGWYYEAITTGLNYRLTDIQAALGVSQLRKLEPFLYRRSELAHRYRERLAGLDLVLPPEATEGFLHAYHLFPIQVGDRRAAYDFLRANGIGVQVHYIPLYRHPLLAYLGSPEDFPNTETVYSALLSLPIYPSLTDTDQDRVVELVREAVS